MRLFNLYDVIFSEKLLYLLSKHSKAVAKASILDFSFEVLESGIRRRKIRFDVEHLHTFLKHIITYSHLLYCRDLDLIPELVDGKIKATKVEAVIILESSLRDYKDYNLTDTDYEIADLVVNSLKEVVSKLEYDLELNSNIEVEISGRYLYKLESGLYLDSNCDLYETVDDVTANKPLFNSLRSRYTDYSHNYFRLYHLLGEYRWEVVLIAKLAKDKQKLDSLLKRG